MSSLAMHSLTHTYTFSFKCDIVLWCRPYQQGCNKYKQIMEGKIIVEIQRGKCYSTLLPRKFIPLLYSLCFEKRWNNLPRQASCVAFGIYIISMHSLTSRIWNSHKQESVSALAKESNFTAFIEGKNIKCGIRLRRQNRR